MFTAFLFMPIALSLCTGFDPSATLYLKRRPSIPLHQLHKETYPRSFRRSNREDDVNLRKTRGVYISNPEPIENMDKMPLVERNEKQDNVIERREQIDRNDRFERKDHVIGKPERSERNERNERNRHMEDKNDRYDWSNRNSPLEKLIRNVHGETGRNAAVPRVSKFEMRVTGPWADPLAVNIKLDPQQKIQDQRQSILRNIQKLSQEDRKLQLEKFRKELRWMSANADEGLSFNTQY